MEIIDNDGFLNQEKKPCKKVSEDLKTVHQARAAILNGDLDHFLELGDELDVIAENNLALDKKMETITSPSANDVVIPEHKRHKSITESEYYKTIVRSLKRLKMIILMRDSSIKTTFFFGALTGLVASFFVMSFFISFIGINKDRSRLEDYITSSSGDIARINEMLNSRYGVDWDEYPMQSFNMNDHDTRERYILSTSSNRLNEINSNLYGLNKSIPRDGKDDDNDQIRQELIQSLSRVNQQLESHSPDIKRDLEKLISHSKEITLNQEMLLSVLSSNGSDGLASNSSEVSGLDNFKRYINIKSANVENYLRRNKDVNNRYVYFDLLTTNNCMLAENIARSWSSSANKVLNDNPEYHSLMNEIPVGSRKVDVSKCRITAGPIPVDLKNNYNDMLSSVSTKDRNLANQPLMFTSPKPVQLSY